MIEMNPRVSRSSALASKATGFPIAKIAARLAVGYALEEIDNDITRKTPASFEPTIDYVVVKWPRFAFEKFPGTDGGLHTSMQSVGEAMAIGRTFKQAFVKAMRSRELDVTATAFDGDLLEQLETPSARPLRGAVRGRAPRAQRSRAVRAHRDRPLVHGRDGGAGARRGPRGGPRAQLQGGGHLRGRVRGGDALLLLGLGAHGGARGAARRAPERRDPRLRAEPDRAGHRVRLLLRARRDDGARVGPRRGDDQLQPGDGLDRLRHLRPPLLRAAHARGRARRDRARAAGGRDRPVRRPDAAEACGWAGRRRRAAAGHARGLDPQGGGQAELRGAARRARPARTAVRHGRVARPGARGGRRRGLPAAGASVLRAGRPRDGDLLLAGAAPGLPQAHQRRRRPDHLPRPLPRERDRDRRGRPMRRRGRGDRRDHAARRGGRRALGRLGLRDPGDVARAGHDAPGRGGHRGDREGARRDRADQHPVRGCRRRRALRDRGEPAGVADGSLRVEGDRRVARQDRVPVDAGRAAWRTWRSTSRGSRGTCP